MKVLPALCSLVLLAAIPDLTSEQRTQLETASDFNAIEIEPAIYPLLRNAVEWSPGDEAGAAVPDYAAILADPAAHRGRLYLLEGRFAVPRDEDLPETVRGRFPLAVTGLTRRGPWDG